MRLSRLRSALQACQTWSDDSRNQNKGINFVLIIYHFFFYEFVCNITKIAASADDNPFVRPIDGGVGGGGPAGGGGGGGLDEFDFGGKLQHLSFKCIPNS